ncbi:MAG: hypothetical protein IJA85_11985 [Clostridia bacterium]|nr:hypothetical protein [Clostridia bacterium]
MTKKSDLMLEFAAAHSLSYDARSETVFGEYRGHPLILCFQDNDALSFVFSLKYKERMPGSALFNDLQNKCKSIHQIKQVRSQVIFVLRKALFGMKKAFALADTALNDITAYLNEKGIVSCCQGCSADSLSAAPDAAPESATDPSDERPAPAALSPYLISGIPSIMCEACYKQISRDAERNAIDERQIRESLPLGIVGALVGAVIGAASIVLIGQLGYVAAISGFLLAVLTVKGYELLGRKLTGRGILACVVIMVLMTWFGQRMDWAFSLYNEIKAYPDQYDYTLTLFEAFRYMEAFLTEDGYNSYLIHLAEVALFVLIGAFPTIRGTLRSQKHSNVTYPLKESSRAEEE